MLLASFWLAMIVAIPGAVAWGITAVMSALLVGALVSYGSARITVHRAGEGASELRVGRARIETRHLGTVVALDADQTRRTAGRDADVRAYLLLRPFLKRSVKVTITDPADPAPYWLVSTRHPDELARALTSTAGSPADPLI